MMPTCSASDEATTNDHKANSTCDESGATIVNMNPPSIEEGHASTAINGRSSPSGRCKKKQDSKAEAKRRTVAEDDPARLAKMEAACATLLECLGEDPSREGLIRTPRRMSEALLACTRGYGLTLSSIVNGAVFEEDHHEMILVKDIDIHSLCEHHMVPFTGKAHIAYIPRSKVWQRSVQSSL